MEHDKSFKQALVWPITYVRQACPISQKYSNQFKFCLKECNYQSKSQILQGKMKKILLFVFVIYLVAVFAKKCRVLRLTMLSQGLWFVFTLPFPILNYVSSKSETISYC